MSDDSPIKWREFEALQKYLESRFNSIDLQMTVGFRGVHERQDKTNGRVEKGEEAMTSVSLVVARLDGRTETVEQTVADIQKFGCQSIIRCREDLPGAGRRPLSLNLRRRDVQVAGGATLLAAALGFFKFGEAAIGFLRYLVEHL